MRAAFLWWALGVYLLRGYFVNEFWPLRNLEGHVEDWDKAHFFTQTIYAFIIGILASIATRNKISIYDEMPLSFFAAVTSADIGDRIWKIFVEPDLDITQVTIWDKVVVVTTFGLVIYRFVKEKRVRKKKT